jgi:hypothetical protein
MRSNGDHLGQEVVDQATDRRRGVSAMVGCPITINSDRVFSRVSMRGPWPVVRRGALIGAIGLGVLQYSTGLLFNLFQ